MIINSINHKKIAEINNNYNKWFNQSQKIWINNSTNHNW